MANPGKSQCAILYSGGTDSTAAAALMASEFDEIHLVTFHERATASSPEPVENIRRLEAKFGSRFPVARIDIDPVLVRLSYGHYLRSLATHHFFNLATPGLSSLSWHVEMIRYCRSRGIPVVADGLTRELMHFPGHQDFFVELARSLYAESGIEYRNPVREWPSPPDFQLVHKLVIDHHLGEREVVPGSTGAFLRELGVFESGNLKGSVKDQEMQKGCYPFVLYNILYFWVFSIPGVRKFWQRGLERFFAGKFRIAREMLLLDQR